MVKLSAKELATELNIQQAPYLNYMFSVERQRLIDMGFDEESVRKALAKTDGDLEAATIILLGEGENAVNSYGKYQGLEDDFLPSKGIVVQKKIVLTKRADEIKEQHNKFMGMYKIQKCREKANHDRRMCVYYHGKGDRRRNPFELPYTSLECPNSSETSVCPDGDKCLKAHTMLERMFHPDLYKISMCQKGSTGSVNNI